MKKKIFKIITIFIFAFLTTFSMVVNLDMDSIIVDIKNDNVILLLTLGLFIYKLYYSYYFKKGNKNNGWYIFLSIIFSVFTVIGYSYKVVGNWDLCFSKPLLIVLSIVRFLGYFIFYNCIMHKLYNFIKSSKEKDIKLSKKIKKIFDEHPFLSSIVIILICWLPYIIAFYPAILSPDPSNQIKQFFGIDTKYLESVVVLDESVKLTNHHPILHTVLLGGCTKIGTVLFNSTNIGLFIYSIIQITILLCSLGYTIKYMKKINTPYIIRLIALLIYSFVPAFPLYSLSAVKDTIFTSLVIIYMINMYDLIKFRNKEKYSNKKSILLCLLILLIMLMRNNGVYLIIMSFPFLLLIEKKNRIKLALILILPLVLYNRYNDFLLPHLKIPQGSIREALSIPFQQSARYVKEYEDDLDDDEREAIDLVLGIDDLVTRYNPDLSDPVKNEYNKYTTDEELKEYFKMWLKGLKKHPDSYVQATINNTYGYFYPDTSNWYVYYTYDKRLKQNPLVFNYSFNKLSTLRSVLSSYAVSYPYIPIIGMIVNIGFSVWLYMYMFFTLLKDKKYKYLIYLTPIISLVLVCIAGPANTYFRYAMPYVFAMPIMVAIFLDILNKKEEC